jgi:putative membrane protein
MTELFQLLLILHLFALVVGVATTVAMPIVMGRMAGAPPEARPVLLGIGGQLGRNGRIAFGALLVTGLTMVLVRYGGFGGMAPAFWVKMALVSAMLVLMIATAVRPTLLPPKTITWLMRAMIAGIIIASVLAFN